MTRPVYNLYKLEIRSNQTFTFIPQVASYSMDQQRTWVVIDSVVLLAPIQPTIKHYTIHLYGINTFEYVECLNKKLNFSNIPNVWHKPADAFGDALVFSIRDLDKPAQLKIVYNNNPVDYFITFYSPLLLNIKIIDD